MSVKPGDEPHGSVDPDQAKTQPTGGEDAAGPTTGSHGPPWGISPGRFREIVVSAKSLAEGGELFEGWHAPPEALRNLVTGFEHVAKEDDLGDALTCAALNVGFQFGKEAARLEAGGEPIVPENSAESVGDLLDVMGLGPLFDGVPGVSIFGRMGGLILEVRPADLFGGDEAEAEAEDEGDGEAEDTGEASEAEHLRGVITEAADAWNAGDYDKARDLLTTVKRAEKPAPDGGRIHG